MLCYYDTPCDARDGDVDGTTPAPTVNSGLWRPPSQAPWAAGDVRLAYYCGNDWQDASDTCQVWCPDADHAKCPYGVFY